MRVFSVAAIGRRNAVPAGGTAAAIMKNAIMKNATMKNGVDAGPSTQGAKGRPGKAGVRVLTCMRVCLLRACKRIIFTSTACMRAAGNGVGVSEWECEPRPERPAQRGDSDLSAHFERAHTEAHSNDFCLRPTDPGAASSCVCKKHAQHAHNFFPLRPGRLGPIPSYPSLSLSLPLSPSPSLSLSLPPFFGVV